MLLNIFFIYLVALATEAAAFPSKRIGRMAVDKNSISNAGEVEKRSPLLYSGQNGRASQSIDTESGLKYQGKTRIRRRGPALEKRRQKIHTKDENTQCPDGGCYLPWGDKKHELTAVKTAPKYVIEKEEMGATDLLSQATAEEVINAAQGNKQHEIKYQLLGNEENSALSAKEVNGEAAGNKLLDQSPQADSDDDYGQAQEEMTQNGIKSSVEEAETNGEQILRPADEGNLALVEKRHKRNYEKNNLETLAAVAEKQREEGTLNNKKQVLVHENEVKFEEGKRRCCNKRPGFSKNKYSLNNKEVGDATDEDNDTHALTDEENMSGNSEDADDHEAMAEDKSSGIENGENKMEEGNVHKIQQRSESLDDKKSLRSSQKGKAGFQEKAPIARQKFACENKQPLKTVSKKQCNVREITRKEGLKKKIGCQEYLEQGSAEQQKQTAQLSGNVDDSKSSLKGRSEGEEGGERDEEETLDTENIGDIQESNDRASVLGNKNDQQQAFEEDNDEQNLEEQATMNEQNQALEGDEVQEEASETKYESRQVPVDEQTAVQSNLEQSENEENKAVESEVPNKRQVSEGELEKEESRQSIAGDQLKSLKNYASSASQNNGDKITVKIAENSERQTEENEQALTDNGKESGEEETKISFETSNENQDLEGENLENESENLQPQETRVQRELPKSENSNETPREVGQSLEQEGSKKENIKQQESLSESFEEQYEPLTEGRETNDIASSETGDILKRENRENELQDLAKIKRCKSKTQPSLASVNDPETAGVVSQIDTQSALVNNNQDETSSAVGDTAINAPQETQAETSEEEYQELEPNSEVAEEQNLQSEQDGREKSKEQN